MDCLCLGWLNQILTHAYPTSQVGVDVENTLVQYLLWQYGMKPQA